jgi:uncharacterized protein DUF1501
VAHPQPPRRDRPSRRELLARAGNGFGLLALAHLLDRDGALVKSAAAAGGPDNESAAHGPLAPKLPHFPARAKSVIWLFINGGPSHVDTWDWKPELEKRDGQPLDGLDPTTGFFAKEVGPIMKSPFRFAQHGESGAFVSEIFPELARHVDDLAFIHSCFTETNNHSPALFQINTGMSRMGFPSVGSWVTYGLGSESQNLPAFVVMTDTLGRGLPKGYAQNWSSGFLPGVYQGTALNTQGPPLNDLARPADRSDEDQRRELDLLGRMNRRHQEAHPLEGELDARTQSFELAYRMQMAAPDALAWEGEPESIRKLYGVDRKECGHFAKQCIMARRLVERGVRFVQLYSGGEENERSWDGHLDIAGNHRQFAGETDRPIAALLSDLKQRGLLDTTLVIWGGEFGRLPVVQRPPGSTQAGRDHNPHAFTTWFCGGGTRGGIHHGATDEIGFKAVQDRVSINDLHATILRLLGIDHTRLTWRHNGRDFRLTDVAGNVVQAVLA